MRQLKVLGICFIASLGVGALSASGASATLLVLKTKNAGVVSPGAAVEMPLLVFPQGPFGCHPASVHGTLSVNSAAKDKATFPSTEYSTTCEEAGGAHTVDQEHFVATSLELTSKGKFSLTAHITVEEPVPCVYELKRSKGTFKVPEPFVFGNVFVAGKRNAKLSNITCAKTKRFHVFWELRQSELNEYLESELRA